MDIEEMKLLKLEPGQVLVVKTEYSIDKDIEQRIRAHFLESVPALKGRILIISSYMTLSALEVV